MGLEGVKARCLECGKMVSDDLVRTEQGLANRHLHEVEVFVVQGLLKPGEILTKVSGLTPESYLVEASKLDAELIVGRIEAKYKIPLPRGLLVRIVEEILRLVREIAIEQEAADRKKAKRASLEDELRSKLKKAPGKKAKAKAADEPLT